MWSKDPKGLFSRKSFYSSLGLNMEVFQLAKNIWIPSVPSKVAFFSWLVAHNKYLTINNLVRMKWELPNRCIMCRKVVESVDHLFIHCEVAKSLWELIFHLFGIKWVLPSSSHDLISNWWVKGKGKDGEWFFTLSSGAFGKNAT